MTREEKKTGKKQQHKGKMMGRYRESTENYQEITGKVKEKYQKTTGKVTEKKLKSNGKVPGKYKNLFENKTG